MMFKALPEIQTHTCVVCACVGLLVEVQVCVVFKLIKKGLMLHVADF